MAQAKDNIKDAAIGSLFWKFLEQGGYAAIGLVVQIVMARLLDPAEFGTLAIMLVFVNIGNVIVQSGLNTAIIQAPEVDEGDYDTVFLMSLGVSLALYGLIFVSAPLIADFYNAPGLVAPLRTITLVLVVNAYNSIQEAIVARKMQFSKTFRATVISALVSGAAGIACALMGGGIWALVVQQLVIQLVKSIVLAAQISWKPRLFFRRTRALQLFGFGWKLLVSGLVDQVYQSLSDLIIGKVFTRSDLGIVSQGKKYPQAVGVVLDGSIQPVMLTSVSRVQDDQERVKRIARRGLKTSTFLIVPAMSLFALMSPALVAVLLGDKWLPSVPFLMMYCYIYALLPIHTTNLQVLNGVGRSDLFLRLEIIKKCIGLTIMLFATFVLRSLTAIVVGQMISNTIATFINAFPNRRVINYSYGEQLRDILPAFLLSAAAAGLAFMAARPFGAPILVLAIEIVVFGVAYLLISWVLHVEAFEYLYRTLREKLLPAR